MKATTHESNPGRHTEVLRFQVVMSAQEYDTYSRLRRTIPTEKDEFQLRAAAEAARTATRRLSAYSYSQLDAAWIGEKNLDTGVGSETKVEGFDSSRASRDVDSMLQSVGRGNAPQPPKKVVAPAPPPPNARPKSDYEKFINSKGYDIEHLQDPETSSRLAGQYAAAQSARRGSIAANPQTKGSLMYSHTESLNRNVGQAQQSHDIGLRMTEDRKAYDEAEKAIFKARQAQLQQ